MAWKSFYLAAGMVNVAAMPFFSGFSGGEHLPNGPCLVVANHSSFLDGPLLSLAYAHAKLLPLHMIAYEEPFHNWLMGWILRCGGAIPFKRGNAASQGKMMTTALGWLAAGEAVGIFPEGHINQKPLLNRPRPGAALLALESGVPVIPAAITGSDRAMPLGRRIPRLGRGIHIAFGKPVMMMDKELRYRDLPREERGMLIRNLGHRIMLAIGQLANRECRE